MDDPDRPPILPYARDAPSLGRYFEAGWAEQQWREGLVFGGFLAVLGILLGIAWLAGS